MRQLKKYVFLLSSILIGIYACQKGIERSSENNIMFEEYRNWLKTSKGIFSEEQIVLQNRSGEKVFGSLNWSFAILSKNKNGDDILLVPFTFNKSVYKNKKVYNDVSAGEFPSIYSLLIKKDKNGSYEGRLRDRSFMEDVSKRKIIINTLYSLTGVYLYSFIRENEKDYPLYNEQINATARTTSCEATMTTSRWVSCEGGMNNTVCTFHNTTSVRYHCPYNPDETIPEEVQNFQPDEFGGGWYEYEESETEYQNQRIIDSLQGYPCAQDILKHLPDIDTVVKTILRDVFGVNDDINIIFRPGINMPLEDDGETQCGGSTSYFKCEVNLNPYVLNNSSKDYIVATFIHEALHAFIFYKRNELGQNSAAFQALFPIYSTYAGGNDPQHNVMSNQYINLMADVIRSFNPNISLENAIKLSWQGLSMTTLWSSQDTTAINTFNAMAKTPAISDFTLHNLRKCD